VFIVSYGIGTSLTNDYKLSSSGGKEKSKALNMVIKLSSVEGKPCIKISDDVTKVSYPNLLFTTSQSQSN
jgi:nicotinate phosphoribosyltransferase